MSQKNQLRAARELMQNVHQHDKTGHDSAHIDRVLQLALTIAEDYPEANLFVIQMATLLHDTVDDKLKEYAISLKQLQSFLKEIAVSDDEQDAIIYVITHISFRKRKDVNALKTIEAKIVQDADRLDALGAIGLARTFQFSGYFKEAMWTGHHSYEELMAFSDFSTLPASAIKHCFEKLLQLKDLMNTEKGKEIAQQRHTFVESFLKQFFNEWQSR
ncbi:HD domain-containing protein [Staphylococcus felis]|uniref:HD domain-containing protein n=1 Tax=Staphylococcus felis TaxID=46127 RepID=A0ABS0QPV9_9STAP|nr:HD domain-containing protein [Staphylococcus felis]MBH9581303.1 HD domain-containing protein [Staphylococcus felis]MDM8327185.1 HD domain-containing protein [Staphylococcus felis]MDQ7191952.1 HD domain-containing protein [Staphylococcus felis]REH74743.1 HD domain-containing protein [Staphylococcus felis]REH90775.1 HD domain-containing protein [Staphylococcus felis]